MGKRYKSNSNKFGARRVYLVENVPFGDKKSAYAFAAQQSGREVVAFDSVKEYNAYIALEQMQARGEISELRRQVVFELLPNQYEIIQTPRSTKRKLLERRAIYTADFTYKDKNGALVVCDVKSPATRKERDYILRRKLMLYFNKIRIKEL